jgi:hypothetical protein
VWGEREQVQACRLMQARSRAVCLATCVLGPCFLRKKARANTFPFTSRHIFDLGASPSKSCSWGVVGAQYLRLCPGASLVWVL